MNGSIAIGSRRTTPTWPTAAAVVSEDSVAPRYTPCTQSRAWVTSGMVVLRRPPKRMASIGTPCGSSYSGARIGHWVIGVQNREFGWEDSSSESGVQSRPFQSVRCAGGSPMPSHQMSPSSVSATLVNSELPRARVRIAFGLVFQSVPGATPNSPYSGLSAYSRPSGPNRIQAMSSPSVSTFQPGMVGSSMARLVLPHADGNAAAMYRTVPCGEVSLRISMCSASQPSSRATALAMRNEKHFLPSSELPPYPEPYDQISRDSGNCEMYFVSEHGHGTSGWPGSSGAPTECRHGTKSASAPIFASTAEPIRAMMRIDTTTYGESVISTPNIGAVAVSGPMQNGMTYIVRPRIQPRYRSVITRFICAGAIQFLG